jgi:hypothetical protein
LRFVLSTCALCWTEKRLRQELRRLRNRRLETERVREELSKRVKQLNASSTLSKKQGSPLNIKLATKVLLQFEYNRKQLILMMTYFIGVATAAVLTAFSRHPTKSIRLFVFPLF